MVKRRKGAFYALESIGAALILFYYLYKVFTIPIPLSVINEKQNIYADDLFYLANAFDNISAYKKLWLSQYDEKDLAYLYQYFISKEGYFEVYASNVPKKNLVVGKYIEPYRTIFTHYLTKSYKTNQECITTYFNNDASFGVIDSTREIKCKEGIFKQFHVLLVLDRRGMLYYKSLYVDYNGNGKYDDDVDYVYTIGRFMDDDLIADGSLYYIQDLPEENMTPYIFYLKPHEKEFFNYLGNIDKIANYSIKLRLRFFTNTTPSFNGFDVVLWDGYLPTSNYDAALWKTTIDYWYEGGDVVILAPIGNSTLLEDVAIYNNTYLGYSIAAPSENLPISLLTAENAYTYDNGLALFLIEKGYAETPIILNHVFSDVSSVTYDYAVYKGVYANLSSSLYKFYVVDDGTGSFKLVVDKDSDGDLNEETLLEKGDKFMLNMTNYVVEDYDIKKVIIRYASGPVLYSRKTPSYFLSSSKDIASHTLTYYSDAYYALDPATSLTDSYTFSAQQVDANTYKATVTIGAYTSNFYIVKKSNDFFIYEESNPLMLYPSGSIIFIKEEGYRWSFDSTTNTLFLVLVYRPNAPFITYLSNDKKGDLLVLNAFSLNSLYKDYYSFLADLFMMANSNNLKAYYVSSYKSKSQITTIHQAFVNDVYHPVLLLKKYL